MKQARENRKATEEKVGCMRRRTGNETSISNRDSTLKTRPSVRIHIQNSEKGEKDMTTDIDRAEVLSRPAAQFDEDGNLEIRASAAGNCRRALWYSATGYEPTNPPSEKSLTAMEAGNALESVVLRAMERAGWKIDPADPEDPQQVTVRIGPNMLATGHPDATGRMPLDNSVAAAKTTGVEMFLFGDDEDIPAPGHGDPVVVEVKTRGPEAFKRWRTLGAERSHPASVAQAALYTLGTYGDVRDAVIATMDTGSRTWDHEVISAERLERALQDACEWLGELAEHHRLNGPDPDTLPDRDFTAKSWQCRSHVRSSTSVYPGRWKETRRRRPRRKRWATGTHWTRWWPTRKLSRPPGSPRKPREPPWAP